MVFGMIYFTSDTHFQHGNKLGEMPSGIIKFCNRPYASAEEMDEALIANWNEVVTSADTVYHLGDFGFGSWQGLKTIRKRLNGHIVLVPGNHDERFRRNLRDCFEVVDRIHQIKDGGKTIVLSHYPLLSWNAAYHGSLHLHGHTHGNITPLGNRTDVGVDVWNYRPICLEEIQSRLVPGLHFEIEKILGDSCNSDQMASIFLLLRKQGVFIQ
jgi:calcineurin-like phosphoesterase family protein